MRKMNVKRHLKKLGWLVVMTGLADWLAFTWWRSYLTTGKVYDGKHGFVFIGESAWGHLAGITLMAAVCSFYLAKSVLWDGDKN